MAEPLTLTEILNDLRAASGKLSKKHTAVCDSRRARHAEKASRSRHWDHSDFHCDCLRDRMDSAKKSIDKMLDYVDGKDFNIKLEFSMSWG